MSSYIPSAKHFNSCERAAKALVTNPNFSLSATVRALFPTFADRNALPARKEQIVARVFDSLRKITVLCVSLQYRNHYIGKLDTEISEQTAILMSNKNSCAILSDMALLSTLRCIKYQIEIDHLVDIRELNEDEANALVFLNEMITSLALYIVTNSAEYKQQPYSID